MPVLAHFIKVSCDQSKPMVTVTGVTTSGGGFSYFFTVTNLGGGTITFPHMLLPTEILTVNYFIPAFTPPGPVLGSITVHSNDPVNPLFQVNLNVTS